MVVDFYSIFNLFSLSSDTLQCTCPIHPSIERKSGVWSKEWEHRVMLRIQRIQMLLILAEIEVGRSVNVVGIMPRKLPD